MIAARQGGERPRSRATAADGGEASEHGHYRQILGLQVQGPPVLVCSFAVPGTRMQRCFYKARVSTLNKWVKWRCEQF